MRFLLLIAGLLLAVPASAQTPFSWDNATVYFVLPDRFENGDTSNDHAYGRGFDGNGTAYAFDVAGHFHGGDLQGLTDRISQGYFDDLGVNAIWLTAFYEQVHGWVGGGDGSFQHYAYHGYYPLDFTAVDSSMGTASQLEAFVDSAHAHGIRVVLDVVMNHAGYNTLSDMTDYDFGAWQGSESDWFSWRPGPGEGWHDYHGAYVDYTDAAGWAQWWGSDFIRAGLPGYTACGGSDELQCLAGLPDFKTETTTALPAGAAGLPPVLVTKWTAEGRLATELAELDAFYTRTGLTRTPRNHIIKWLTDWVREFGIDGYRVDTAKHVELPAWSALKAEATLALAEWKTNNPTKKVDDLPFWMTAEVFGHGAFRSIYHDNGFDSVINFAFQGQAGDPTSMEPIYSGMAAGINSDPTYNLLSYISSHDTQLFDRGDLIDAGTSLFMLPGGVQVFYGDETARPNGVTPSGDPQQATRSPMNWSAPDAAVLSHWQKLGQFRNRHLAVGAGQHQQITATSASSTPYAFKRTYSSGGTSDQVAVVFNAAGSTTVDVSTLWADGVQLTDAYTGNVATVSAGVVTFSPSTNGVLLIEGPAPIGAIPQIDISSPDLTGGVTFSTDPIDIEIAATDVEDASLTIHYTTDGSAPTTSSPVYTVPFEITSTTTVRALVEDTDGNLATASKTYTIGAGLTVHFKKPASWSAPYVHYFNTDPDVGATTWPGVAMTSEGCDWYSYTIAGTGSAGLVFNANTSPQTIDLTRSQEGWFTPTPPSNGNWGGTWSDTDPDGPCDPGNDPPQVAISPSSQISANPITVTISASDDSDPDPAIFYTTDGSIPTSASTAYGAPFSVMTTTTVRAVAIDDQNASSPIASETYTIGSGLPAGLTVHFKRPAGWGLPHIHFWNTTPAEPATTWPGRPMVSEGCGWYSYTFDVATQTNIVFNGAPANPIPQTVDLSRDTEGWYTPTPGSSPLSGTWSDTDPEPGMCDMATLDLKVYPSGFYQNGSLSKALDAASLLPNRQPYTAFPDHPNEYYGLEQVGAAADIADWVLVEFRTSTTAVSTDMVRAGFVKADGTVVDVDGSSFDAPVGDYYIVVRHRNHLPVMSASAVTFTANTASSYDFTTSQAQAFGTDPMVEVSTGVFGMPAGDFDLDQDVDLQDVLQFWLPANGSPDAGYFMADADGSTTDDAGDGLKAAASVGKTSQVPD